MSAPKFPELEEKILKQWDDAGIFRKTLEKPAPKGDFIFFEGPPTANGKPGIHHLIARYFKDIVTRYKTMAGYHVERKAGWDTHGLPVEIEVEKKLGFKSKRDIEKYGIAEYNRKCRESVWEYKSLWDQFTRRSGYWVDLEHPYITYDKDYIESLWWIVKKIADRKLLYEGYKVVPHCPRCGTTLASHELAQGYEDVDDVSVYVRFKIKDDLLAGASFLVWTTTPWTLPSNVALAIGSEIMYSEIKTNSGERLILATARLGCIEGGYELLRELPGKDLIGVEYEPPYSFVVYDGPAHHVLAADFVSTADGTGIVHIAPMYGVDDFNLGVENKLPQKHLVNMAGEFAPEVKPWAGLFVKKADPLIVEELAASGKLYKKETIRHTYPFCWRCKTPLIYYAKPSWYFKTSEVAEQMIKANEEIHWEPEHLKEGRFGEWLKGNKDWAVTRERYWATPLPVWKCANDHRTVIGSYDDLEKRRLASATRILLVRHGEAENNVQSLVASGTRANGVHLTEKGKEMATATAKKLAKEKLAAVYSSPLTRTKETAEIIAAESGLKPVFDERLREIEFGVMNGKTEAEFTAFFPYGVDRWTKKPEGGENFSDVRKRVLSALREISAKHPGEAVAVVTHGDPLFVVDCALNRVSAEKQVGYRYPGHASVTEVSIPNWPWNEDGELDPHRPYIDEVTIKCEECGEEAKRVKDVMDVWFDSGSMPFAQWHYPFENKERIDKNVSFPADYISEAIDQTRGWFYTLLAVSTLLGYKHPPFKNVISMNHILDAKGFKMSKSKGNVVDPWKMFEKYGADAVRFFLFIANQPGDYKRFDEKDVDSVVKKTFLILWNVMEFWKLCRSNDAPRATSDVPIMDRWLDARLNQLVKKVTEELDAFRPTDACRVVADFVNELSTWYVRRSRDRFRAGESVEPLRAALVTVAKLMAPMTPFVAEALWQELEAEGESVHLVDWPKAEEKMIDSGLLEEMDAVRKIVEIGHALRDEAGVKLRQPLSEVEVENAALSGKGGKNLDELLPLAAEEMNVKLVKAVDHIEERGGWMMKSANGFAVALRTEITDELKREGWMREISRQVNDLRKEAKLKPADRITLSLATEDIELRSILTTEKEHLTAAARADEVVFEAIESEFARELDLDGKKLAVTIKK
jgi:isoleucyl-tRNA synthetase